MEAKLYMSIRETAKYTGIAESFLRTAVRDKRVPGVYSGRKFLVYVPKFLQTLEEQSGRNEVVT